MKTKATVTPYVVDVDIDPLNFFKEIAHQILSKNKLNLRCYEKDGKIVEDMEYHTSHSWETTEVRIEKPNVEELNLLRSFKLVYSEIKKMSHK